MGTASSACSDLAVCALTAPAARRGGPLVGLGRRNEEVGQVGARNGSRRAIHRGARRVPPPPRPVGEPTRTCNDPIEPLSRTSFSWRSWSSNGARRSSEMTSLSRRKLAAFRLSPVPNALSTTKRRTPCAFMASITWPVALREVRGILLEPSEIRGRRRDDDRIVPPNGAFDRLPLVKVSSQLREPGVLQGEPVRVASERGHIVPSFERNPGGLCPGAPGGPENGYFHAPTSALIRHLPTRQLGCRSNLEGSGHSSTIFLRRSSASSHRCETKSRVAARVFKSLRLQLPDALSSLSRGADETRFRITRRCLVIAWRVTSEPAVSLAMDAGPPSQSRPTSRKRVSSPSAAKMGADSLGLSPFAAALRGLFKVLLDQLDDHCPALFVCRERRRTAREGDSIEARFGDREHDAVRDLLQVEDDECGRLRGVSRRLAQSRSDASERKRGARVRFARS